MFSIILKITAVPATGTLVSFHSLAPGRLHCRTKCVTSVPPLMGRVLSERRAEAGPGLIFTLRGTSGCAASKKKELQNRGKHNQQPAVSKVHLHKTDFKKKKKTLTVYSNISGCIARGADSHAGIQSSIRGHHFLNHHLTPVHVDMTRVRGLKYSKTSRNQCESLNW